MGVVSATYILEAIGLGRIEYRRCALEAENTKLQISKDTLID